MKYLKNKKKNRKKKQKKNESQVFEKERKRKAIQILFCIQRIFHHYHPTAQ